MANQRALPRLRRRLRVCFGSTPAFTADVSPGGFAAELMRVPRPGTTVHGKLTLGGRTFAFTGLVRWAKSGDPRLSVRGRVGVRFTGIANEFYTLFLRPSET